MIIDAHSIESGSTLSADVCIVGSGAAGITLALDLSGRGLSVLLLESGKLDADAESQALYAGEVADEGKHSPPDKYRQRRFGGSTTIWGGRCMPFDPIDFETRTYVPHSGWPISFDAVARYYPQASEWAETGECEFNADIAFDPIATAMIDGFHSERVTSTGLERFSCPTNFAARYRRRLELAPNLRVVLEANCTAIRMTHDGASVKELGISTLSGHRWRVTARRVVLAVGGLEAPRMLLASRDVQANGIGNLHDVVGRYYMCHIAGTVGTLAVKLPAASVRHGYLVSKEGVYCRRRLSLTASEQRRIGAMNTVARLHFSRISDPSHRNGVLSGLFLAKKMISYEYGKRLNDGHTPRLAGYARHLRNVIADPVDTAAFLSHWLTRRTLAARKFPSVILRNRSNLFSLDVHGEQQPQPESRVTLGHDVDALGMPRVKVDWRYTSEDIESIRRTLDVFAQEFQNNRAEFRYDADRLETELTQFGAYGGHHIGTTRMGLDPRSSVVDADCRVHGVSNLHVAGSAVFATSSQANPTLTIIAMALRLSQHLADQLKTPRPAPAAIVATQI